MEKTPSEATKEELSKQLELGYEQVTVWFMNRRAKDRRQGLVAKKSRMTRHQLATLEKTYACEFDFNSFRFNLNLIVVFEF